MKLSTLPGSLALVAGAWALAVGCGGRSSIDPPDATLIFNDYDRDDAGSSAGSANGTGGTGPVLEGGAAGVPGMGGTNAGGFAASAGVGGDPPSTGGFGAAAGAGGSTNPFGGTAGSGPIPGTGGGPPSTSCDTCLFSAFNTPQCKMQDQQCAQQPGCAQLAKCVISVGCANTPDPIDCALQKGCQNAPPIAQARAFNLLTCGVCNQCDASCNVSSSNLCEPFGGGGNWGTGGGPPGQGGGPGQGGSWGTGGNAGSAPSPQACSNCMEQNFWACENEYNQCESSQSCMQLLDCRNNCESFGCIESCRTTFPAGAKAYDGLVNCLECKACPSTCSGMLGGTCN